MLTDTGRGISVDGNAVGQFTTGDHNVMVSATHSTVTIIGHGQRPKPQRRSRIERLPRRGGYLLGRDGELGVVAGGVSGNEPVQLYGPDGIGKSALVRHAIFEIDGHDGVVFLDGYGSEVDDLLQSVFEACYDTQGYRPTDGELQRLLADIRVCLVVDDFGGSTRDLTRIEDMLPAGTVLFASQERLLWGKGRAVALAGLPELAGLDLLARELRRPLQPTDIANATALWQASNGHPFVLIRAAALARPDHDGGVLRLPAPGEVPALLRQIIGRLGDLGRWILTLLAVAPDAHVSTEVLAWMLPGSADTAETVQSTVEDLTRLGLLAASDHGFHLSATTLPADLTPDQTVITEATARLTQWATARATTPASIADHSSLIAAYVEVVGRAGRPDLGVRLARAAAPGAACSLRWEAWKRILTRGLTAAQQAGDEPARAYFTHENGVRSLLTGKRVAAVAAFAAAAAIWHTLNDHAGVALAEHSQTLANPGAVTSAPPTDPTAHTGAPNDHTATSTNDVGSHADPSGTGTDPGSTATHSSTGSPPSNGTGTPGSPGQPASGPGGGHTPSLPIKGSGLSLTAKVVIGASLIGAVAAGSVYVIGQGNRSQAEPTVPLHVQVITDVFEVKEMPGTPEGPCPSGTGKTNCKKVVQIAKGKEGPVEVVPAGPLPPGITIAYWGCKEGPASASCTVKADKERTVCATTTSPTDEPARRICQQAGGGAPPPQQALVRVQVASDAWDITITPDAPGTKPCVSPPTPQDRICQFLVQAGTRITLTTRFSGTNPFTDRPFSGGPAWFGCDEGPATPNPIRPGDVGPDTTFPNVTTTCALNLDTGRAVCLGTTDPNDSGATWACSMFYAENPRVQIPLGATSLGPTSSGSAQSAAPGSGSIDSPAAAPRFNPCTVITTEDLTRAAKYLKNSTERTWSSGNTEERSKPSFGSCVYQPVDLNTRPMGMVTVSYGENRMSVSEWEAELRRYSDCEALNIGKRAMQCKGREGNVFVYLADGTTLHVLVTKFVSAVGLADGFPDADTSIALARLIASRV